MLPNFGSSTVHELVCSHGATPAVQELADTWTQSLFSRCSHCVSALTFLLHCKTNGGFRQILEGEGSVCLRGEACEVVAAKLHAGSVITEQAVERIDQAAGNKCVISTQSGSVFQCSKVILAIPLSQYRDLEFRPEISEDKQWLQSEALPANMELDAACLAIPAANLRNLDHDQWQPEGNIHFAGSETSHVWRGHVEGALSAGSRAVVEVLEAIRPSAEAVYPRL